MRDDKQGMDEGSTSRGLFRVDPGWLYLVSGLALLVSVMVLPAIDDLAEAQWERDKARARVAWQSARIERHARFLDSVSAGDETTIRNLAATQLNLTPAGTEAVIGYRVGPHGEAGLMDTLDPAYVAPERVEREQSTLQWLATDTRVRLVTLAAGSMCVALGLVMGVPGRARPEAGVSPAVG